VTLSSFMRSLAHEAIEDPTAVEAKVRAQMEKRKLAHEMHNESRRLAPAQKKEKHRKKLQEDTSHEVQLAAFKLKDLNDNRNRFKVIVNAEQYNLTGVLILFQDCNIVFIEGGSKGIRKYYRLLMERIRWNSQDLSVGAEEEEADEEDEEEVQDSSSSRSSAGYCQLIWKVRVCLFLLTCQGVSSRRSFANFKVHSCASEPAASKLLSDKGFEHIWISGKSISFS